MIRRLLLAWSARLPARAIAGEDGEPYLERYFVGRALGVTVYLHRFVASDPDRGLHDHPWGRAVSLVLAGGYDEERQEMVLGAAEWRPAVRTVRRRPGRLNLLRGWDFHRVVLRPGDGDCWSLFAHGPVVKEWGFLVGAPGRARMVDLRYRSRDGWWRLAPRGATLRARQGRAP